MSGWDKSEVAVAGSNNTDKRHSVPTLDDDGTVFGSVSTSCAEAPHGMSAELPVMLPATVAPSAIEHHLKHFSVKFRSWMLVAAEENGENA